MISTTADRTLHQNPGDSLLQASDQLATNNEIKRLCELKSALNIAFVFFEWSAIFLTIYCTQRFFNPLTYFLAVVWIGSRLHALAILMHEAAHWRLFKQRALNEFIGEVFCAWPILMTLRGYRNTHLIHHRNLNTLEDPDWDSTREDYWYPKTKLGVVLALLHNALGIGFLKEAIHTVKSDDFNQIPNWLRNCQYAFFASVVIASIVFGFWKLLLLYWAVPFVTSFVFFAYVRAIAEHYALDYSHELRNSRNTITSFWESILIAPYNVGYHLDHHKLPGVPWYNLRKLHKVLLQDSEYRDNAHITNGYLAGLLKECTEFKNPVAKEPPLANVR